MLCGCQVVEPGFFAQSLIAFENVVGLEPKKYMGDNFEKVTNIYKIAQFNVACCYSQLGQARPIRRSHILVAGASSE